MEVSASVPRDNAVDAKADIMEVQTLLPITMSLKAAPTVPRSRDIVRVGSQNRASSLPPVLSKDERHTIVQGLFADIE